MNKEIQQKMERYKKMANSHPGHTAPTNNTKSTRTDSLSKVIRSKEEADIFMAELESAFKRSK